MLKTDKIFALVQEEKKDGKLASVTVRETVQSNGNVYKINFINGAFHSFEVFHNNQPVGSFVKQSQNVVSAQKEANTDQHELFAEYRLHSTERIDLPNRVCFWALISNDYGRSEFLLNTDSNVFQLKTAGGKYARFSYDETKVQRLVYGRDVDSLDVKICSGDAEVCPFNPNNLRKLAVLGEINHLDPNKDQQIIRQIQTILSGRE